MSDTVEKLYALADSLEKDGFPISAALVSQGAKELAEACRLVYEAYNPENGLIYQDQDDGEGDIGMG